MKYGLLDSQLKVVETALQSYSEVEEAVLFGSRAIGSFKEASDVDIALKGKKANTTIAVSLKGYFEEETNLPYFFDFLSYASISNKKLKNHIDKYGIVIYRKGWRKVKLGEVSNIIGGFAFKSKDFTNFGDVHVVRIKDIKPPFIDIQNSTKIYSAQYSKKKLNKFKINEEDFIVAMTGATIGKIGRFVGSGSAYINQRVAKIEPKQNINKQYIYYNIQNNDFQSFIKNNIDSNSAQENISATSIGRYLIFLPPLSEQKAIAEVLSSLDDKIELLHKQNKTLENIAQTLFHKWFIEDAKDDWEKGKLGDILETIESGSRPKGGIDPDLKEGVPSIGAESINGIGNFDFSKTKYISTDFFKNMKKGIIRDYDVLIYKDGAYIGKKAMFGQDFPFQEMSVNEHIFILRANSKTNQFFIYFLLNQQELLKLNTNSAQPGLNQQAMKSFKIIMPPKNKMDHFGKITKSWIEKILFNSNQIRELENIRNTLLPKLISGTVKINR